MADATPPAPPKPAAAAPAPAAPPAPPKDMRNPAMKQLFAQVQAEQKRLGWSDARLCEFANQTVAPIDPYQRLKVTTVDFIARLRPQLLQELVKALQKQR